MIFSYIFYRSLARSYLLPRWHKNRLPCICLQIPNLFFQNSSLQDVEHLHVPAMHQVVVAHLAFSNLILYIFILSFFNFGFNYFFINLVGHV